jgi:hypothetical protein
MPDKSEIWDRAPQLHHYTDWGGLHGIYSSNTIRATHYKELNDTSEIEHFRKELTTYVAANVKQGIIDRKKQNRSLAMEVSKLGGAVRIANHFTGKTMSALYRVTYHGVKGPPYCEPFIASFCNHSQDEKYERENGLLSQWVGYGGEERYALVFDTKNLRDVLQKDTEHYAYASMAFEEVVYDTNALDFGTKYAGVIDSIATQVNNLIADDQDSFRLDDVYKEFTKSAAYFKHRAFQEEREVRIFSAPHTKEMEQHLRESQSDLYESFKDELKTVHPQDSQQKKHIVLFDAPDCGNLPFIRIIVGPGAGQERWKDKVKSLVGNRVRVTCSETPFLG